MEAYKSYLPYSDYKELGGELPESAFNLLERKAQRWLDYFTFNRIKCLTRIPNEVKEVLVEYVTQLDTFNKQRQSNGELISQYSNGVEQVTYSLKSEATFKKELNQIAIDWLPDFLTYRGANFDVREYLQSDSDYS